MKITRKEVIVNENMLNDMYAECLANRFAREKQKTDRIISLAVYVDVTTGEENLCDIMEFGHDELDEAIQDYETNKSVFNSRKGVYYIFIIAQRIPTQPYYTCLQCEAIER